MEEHTYFKDDINTAKLKQIGNYVCIYLGGPFDISPCSAKRAKQFSPTEPKIYKFLDKADQIKILGSYDKDIMGFAYLFKRFKPIPKVKENAQIKTNIRDLKLTAGDIAMYLIYIDDDDEVKAKFAKVSNLLEYNTKHFDLLASCSESSKFIIAGELQQSDDPNIIHVNAFSGTYMARFAVRLVNTPKDQGFAEEYDYFDKEQQSKVLEDENLFKEILTGSDNTLINWLSINHKPYKFEYKLIGFKNRTVMSFTTLLNDTEDQPRVVLLKHSDVVSTFNAAKAVATLHVYTERDRYNKLTCSVTRKCAEKAPFFTGALSLRDIFSNNYPITNKYGQATFVPTPTDLKNARRVLQKLNWKVVPNTLPWGNIKYFSTNDINYFDIEDKTFVLSDTLTGENVEEVTILSKFPASMNDVYKVKVTKKLEGETTVTIMVMKVTSAYTKTWALPLFDPNMYKQYGYETKKEYRVFALPNTSALCNIIPYLGTTLSDISFEDRLPHWNQFKVEYIQKTFGDFKEYNDYKPENTTWDEKTFHLIDRDKFAHTPAYYGPTDEQTVFNKVFGILLVLNWFLTGSNPIQVDNLFSEEDKLKWGKATDNKNPEIQELFDVLFDSSKTDDDKFREIQEVVGLETVIKLPSRYV